MKRIIALSLSAILVALSCIACSSNPVGSTHANSNPATVAPTTATPTTIAPTTAPVTVDVTIPASFYEGEDAPEFDPDEITKEEGYLSATRNPDGSVTIIMTKAKHDQLLAEQLAAVDAAFDELVEGENTPYIKEITYSQDMTAVTMKVVRSEYESTFDLTPLSIYFNVIFYQMLLNVEMRCEITIVDVDTGDTITSVACPDDLGG